MLTRSTVHLVLFCTMTNKCTIISLIITLLRVSTLSCHPQGVSSSSVGATTLGGFWPALRFRSTFFYLYTSLYSFSLSSSLNPLLLGQAISVLVFLLDLMNMVPIQSVS